MNYIDEARWMLKHYDQLRAAAINLEQQAASLYAMLCPAGTYSQMIGRVGPASTVPRDVADAMLEVTGDLDLVELRNKARQAKAELKQLDRAIDSLDERHRRVVVLRFRERFSWKEVAAAMNISERTAYYWAKEAVREVAIAMWGRQAVAATITRSWLAPADCRNAADSSPPNHDTMSS